jgi:N,N'-diacetyllegionaminate synthase
MNKVLVIAEAGVNHNGSIETAKKMIDVAVDSGSDAVKFQTFKAEKLVNKNVGKAEYQKRATGSDESQFEMIQRLELDIAAHKELMAYCQSKGILFLSTPFDHESIDLLNELGLCIFKIPSGEITNLPYLKHIGSLKKEVILSTGMSSLGEVEEALAVLINAGTVKESITVLHANTEYPTPMEDVNLRAMQTIADAFKVNVGYSDHTLGIEVDIAAVAMGARIIEKHFTLDRLMEGPDHQASLEPDELKTMVKSIRNIELALGSGIKGVTNSERKNIEVARKSIVAKQEIQVGDLFSESNLTVKRPGNGKSPMEWYHLLGTVAKKQYAIDEQI